MASRTVSAVDYLAQPEEYPPRPVCVAFGNERFLRRQSMLRLRKAVLGDQEGEFSLSLVEGRTADVRDVLDEVATVAMFGSGKRLVVVSDADEFVSRSRAELEDYVHQPAGTGVLALDLKSFPGNTRLYKAVAAQGLLLDCNCPRAAVLVRWLQDWANQNHRVQLDRAAAEVLLDTVGPELGLLDQELAKLALTVRENQKITPEVVSRFVGGWRTQTTWEMLDAALAGDVQTAVVQLERLFSSGETAIGLLGQVSVSLRRLAAATRLVLQAERSGRPITLRSALQQSGVRPFVLQKAEQQLRHLGRHRGAQLYRWLLEADLGLKGASAAAPRFILEQLVVRLALPRQTAR